MTGLVFEKFIVGSLYKAGSVTIRESMVDDYANLFGDSNSIHTGFLPSYHPFEQRVAHGLLVASAATGLVSALGLTKNTLVAMLEQKLVYHFPVYCGDVIHVEMQITDKRITSTPSRGIVDYEFTARNADNKVVLKGKNKIMVFTKQQFENNKES